MWFRLILFFFFKKLIHTYSKNLIITFQLKMQARKKLSSNAVGLLVEGTASKRNYWTKFGSTSPKHSKAYQLISGCDKGKCSVYCKAKQGKLVTTAKTPKALQEGFKGKVRKRVMECLISLWTFFWLVDSEVTRWCYRGQCYQLSGSSFWGLHADSHCTILTPGGGFSTCKTTQAYGSGCYL